MNAFSPAWLALRESADLVARNRDVLAACQRHFERRDSLRICDIGAGTGASVRAFADFLPIYQHWTLVDHNAENLAAAVDVLSDWADTASQSDGRLSLKRGARHIEVSMRCFDFAQDPASCWTADTGLVTASALLDLTSKSWIAHFANALSTTESAVLATLTFDGTIVADPSHPLDNTVAEAFRAHQLRDKGFGPAAGSAAADSLKLSMERLGYKIVAGSSPWHFEDRKAEVFIHTIEGIATAAHEIAQMDSISDWQHDRLTKTRLLTIGHTDVFSYRQ